MHTRSLFIITLALLAVLERVMFDLGPNIELVTTISVVAGLVATTRWRIIAPLAVMIISDFYLGVSSITLFTWSGFLLMPWLAAGMRRKLSSSLTAGVVSAFTGVIWFYVWTNFGVWLTEGYGIYPNTLSGLLASYVAGLPFVRLQLLSALVSVPLALVSLSLIERKVGVSTLLPAIVKFKKT
jgi:hypothetical protein